jgi:hypothetical protein
MPLVVAQGRLLSMRQPPTTISDAIVSRPTTFEVGAHALVVTKILEGRWRVAVDGKSLDTSFDTQADAWEAGVREADRLDRVRGA